MSRCARIPTEITGRQLKEAKAYGLIDAVIDKSSKEIKK